ncbi:MAG: PEGA domain-containing protein [Treponema sp.]|nr:PEGA domain-containing protein [Treponema sp.]
MKRVKLFFTFIISSLLFNVYAETFRVSKTNLLNLEAQPGYESSIKIGINDAIAISLPENRKYLEGIELKIQIPKIVSDWRDCVAFSIYDDISPKPHVNQIDYNGKKIYVTPIPQKLNWIVQIPLSEDNSIRDSSYVSKLNIYPDTKNNFAFFRFQPAMKGVPDETYDALLQVTVKPVLKNLGELSLKVENSAHESLSSEVFIDDKSVILNQGKILLEPGLHNISVQNAEYRNEFRSIVIDQAKTTEVKLTLRSNDPMIKILAPHNAQISLDSKTITSYNEEFPISEGEHSIRCLLGGYELVRTVNIQKGKTYCINLIVDMEITEE